jgi:succinoglycan biosynthesis transport protein ExoP
VTSQPPGDRPPVNGNGSAHGPSHGSANGSSDGGGRGWWPFRRSRRKAPDATESFRHLALQLHLDLADLEGGRLVMLASPVDAELCMGTTLELAWFLAEEHGHDVAVLDCSLDRQELTEHMGHAGEEGLLDYLADDDEPTGERLKPTAHDRVVFGPAGTRQLGMGQMLVRRRIENGVGWLRKRFDYVLLYAPPLLTDASGLGFASAVDCALLVAQEGKSRLDDLDRGQALLESHGARHVGLVLTEPVKAKRLWSLRRR